MLYALGGIGLLTLPPLRRAAILRIEADRLARTVRRSALWALQAEEDLQLHLLTDKWQLYRADGEQILATHQLSPLVQIDHLPPVGSTVTFYSSGVLQPISISLKNNSKQCQVIISLRGRIRTECK